MAEGEKGQIGTLTKENQDLRRQLEKNAKKTEELADLVKKLTATVQSGFVRPDMVVEDEKKGEFPCTIEGCEKEPFKTNQALQQHVRMAHKGEGTG